MTHIYVANFTLIDIQTDEHEDYEIPIASKTQSLSEVEAVIAEHALSMYATYVIKNVKHYGYPFTLIKPKEESKWAN